MRKNLVVMLVLALMISLVGIAPIAFGATLVDFSGDVVLSDAKGKISNGKIFIKGGFKIRQEFTDKNSTVINIIRIDKMVTWTLLSNNQYLEVKLPANPNGPQNDQYDIVSLGTQTINGYPCDGTQYIYKNKSLGSSTVWVSTKLGYGLKVESKDTAGKLTSTFEIKNIKEGAEADSLFEIPAGYSKMNLQFTIPGT